MTPRSSSSLPPFYVTGGTLPVTAQSYVERQADRDLLSGLVAGEFCYVLDTRQMGKSSLMIRTAGRLRAQGIRCAVLDLTGVGQNLTPDRWYAGLLSWLDEQLQTDGALLDYWREHKDLGGLQRFIGGIRLALMLQETPLVIFVDEIDSVRSLPFSADEFFAGVRECYNRRTLDAAFQRLTFCLLGVATPADLISDARISPFNIGRRIVLTDFSPEEAAPLAEGLTASPQPAGAPAPLENRGEGLLARVLHWTGGHPYLTQRLCRALADQIARPASPPASPAALVDPLCERLFLSRQARETDDNLMFVRNSLLHSGEELAGLLDLYSRIRAGRRIPADETASLQSALRLAGVVRSVDGMLRPRNRIYDHVFDPAWVRSHMPDAELRRQRAAYRRGLLRATGVAAGILVVMSGLALAAVRSAARAQAAQSKLKRVNGQLSQLIGQQQQITMQLQSALQQSRQNQSAALAAQRLAHLKQLQAEAAERRAKGHQQQALLQEKIARHEKGIAQQQRTEARRQLSRNLAQDGARLLEQGDPLNALRPLTEALRLEEGDPAAPARQRCLRRRTLIGSVLAETPALTHLWTANAPIVTAEYRADGQRIVTVAGATVRILNPVNGAIVAVRKFAYRPSVATFDPQGARVAIGGANRDVEVCNPETLRTEQRLPVEAPAGRMCWSHDGRWLAVASEQGGEVFDVAAQRKILNADGYGKPNEVAFSPDDSHLAVVSYGFITWVCALKSADPVVRLPNSYNSPTVAFAPNGRTVLVQGDPADGSPLGARIYDVQTGAPASPLFAQAGGGPARFSPDGRRIAVGDRQGVIRLWDVATGEAVTEALGRGAPVLLLQFSADGQRILSADADGVVQVWDADTGDRIGPALHHAGAVRVAAFAPDGWHVLTAGDDQTLRVWDLRRMLERSMLSLPSSPQKAAELLSNGARLLVSMARTGVGSIAGDTAPPDDRFDYQVYDTDTGRRVIAPPTNGDFWRLRSVTGDGRRLALACAHAAQVWDVGTGRRIGPLIRTETGWDDLAISPDGSKLLLLKRGDHAELYAVTTGRLLCALPSAPGAPPMRIMMGQGFSSNSRYAILVCRDNSLQFCDVTTGANLFPPLRHESQFWQLAFTPDGQRLFTVTANGIIRLWSGANGHLLAAAQIGVNLKERNLAVVFAFSRDGRRAVICLPQQLGVSLWDLSRGTHRLIPEAEGTLAAVFRPNSRMVTLCGPHRILLCDAATGRRLKSSALSDPDHILVSPDGGRIAAYGANGLVAVWDSDQAQPLSLLRHPQRVSAVAFSPDGRTLATTCVDSSMRVWDVATGDLECNPQIVPDTTVLLFTPDGRQLVIGGWHENRIVRLAPNRRDSEALRRLALLLAGPSDGTASQAAPASPAMMQTAWRAIQGKRPLAPFLSRSEEMAWRYRVQSAARLSAKIAAKKVVQRQLQLRDETERAVSAPPGQTENWSDLARQCMHAGQWEWAATAATRELEQTPQEWEAWYLRAVARERQGRYQEALADMKAAIQYGQKGMSAWKRQESLKAALGQWEEAASDYRQVVSRIIADPDSDPEFAAPLGYQYALLLLKSGRLPEYRRLCAQMLAQYGGETSACTIRYVVLTCCLAPSAVANPGALATLAQSISKNSDPEVRAAMALALIRAGRPAEALPLLEASAFRPEPGQAAGLIRCLAQTLSGAREAARPELERAKRTLAVLPIGIDLTATGGVWQQLEVQLLYNEMVH
jgi:WD40 repeat protein/tetratricopeptide (TPR) repeat protein